MAAPRIRLENIDMRFPTERGDLKVVDDVSLTIHEGEFVALVGPSGCGKTTLLNMMAGFLRPSGGHVLLDGTQIEGPGRDRGVMFQEYGVFPWLTVKENIKFGLRLAANKVPSEKRDEICDRYMRLMRLTDFANSFPKTLSGGMRQRVALARAYAVNPTFLLMDEPFGALDAQTRSAMQDLLLEVLASENKTVVMITHSVDEALYLASRIVVISARPARIRKIIDVPFGYPRQDDIQERPEFSALRSEIKELVMQEYAAQEQQARLRLSD